MKMSHEDSSLLLTSLQNEFLTDGGHLAELNRDIAAAIAIARDCGRKEGTSIAWEALWQQQWNDVSRYTKRIQVLLGEMEQYTRSSSADLLQAAMEAWEELQAEDCQLSAAIASVKEQAAKLWTEMQADCREAIHRVDSLLIRVHTLATVLRIRVELLRANSREGVDSLVSHLLATLPGHSPKGKPGPELRRQMHEHHSGLTEQEQHRSSGIFDFLKVLLMWNDKPVEKAGKDVSLAEDQVEN